MRALLIAAGVLLVALPVLAADPLPDAITEQELFSQGKKVSTAKVYVSGGRVRSETTVGGQTMTTLLDRGAKMMWLVMPPVGCIEQPVTDRSADVLGSLPADATEELVGKETIDGHPTEKYKIRATIAGKTSEHYQWRATDLDGFPIRTAAVDGSYEQRFTKIELKTPDAKLFEKPANCRPMPEMGGSLPPGAKSKPR
jgi:hypothetical protein